MAATKQPTVVQSLGNLSATRVTFYQKNAKPVITNGEGFRTSFLYFKTDKEKNELRSSMAVQVRILPRNGFTGEFYAAMLEEVQDSILKRVADGELPFETSESAEAIEKDYFDTTRIGGRKVKGEDVGKWFDATMTNWLMDKIVAKFPQFDADKVVKVVGQYRQAFCDLTKYGLPQSKPVTDMIQKAFKEWFSQPELEEADEMTMFVGERIKKLADKHNAEEMLIDAI